MGIYDQAARYAAQADPASVPTRLLRANPENLVFQEWFDTRGIPLPGGADRAADLVATMLQSQKRWLIVLEFQAQQDVDKLDVTLEEIAVLRCRARYGEPRTQKYNVLAGLIYLAGRCPDELLDMTLADGRGTRHAPLVWNVAEDDASSHLDAIVTGTLSWGTLFWIALMSGADQPSVVDRWKELVLAQVEDRARRGDLAAVATVFAELAGRGLVWNKGLKEFDMTESQVANAWISRGEQKGKLQLRREDLLEALQRKFPNTVPEEVRQLIQEQDSLALLHDWFWAAIDATTFEDFMAVLKS